MKVRSIPPITSTGKNRRKTPALLQGLAHVSVGRYMFEMARSRKNEEGNEAWSVAKYARSEFNHKPEKKAKAPVHDDFEHRITCQAEMFEDYNADGDFAISLQFKGIEFSGTVVSTYADQHPRRCFMIPVSCKNIEKESYLLLTTIGDIFEYEVVRDVKQCCVGKCFMGHTEKRVTETGEKEFCPNRLFRDEAYIPKLLDAYDSLTMKVVIKDHCVIVTYKKTTI